MHYYLVMGQIQNISIVRYKNLRSVSVPILILLSYYRWAKRSRLHIRVLLSQILNNNSITYWEYYYFFII